MDIHKNCKFIKADGNPCKNPVIKNSDFCFFHDPESKEDLKIATIKGGKQGKRKTLKESNLRLRNINDVISLLETIINEVRRGDIASYKRLAIFCNTLKILVADEP